MASFRACIGLAAACVAAALPAPTSARPLGPLAAIWATNGDTAYARDRPLLTTISPNGDGFRDSAIIHVRLARAARVELTVAKTAQLPTPVYRRRATLGAGTHTFVWAPPKTIQPRTYLVLLTATSDGARVTYGAATPAQQWTPRTPTIRVQGIDAGAALESYRAGDVARLRVATDAQELHLQVFGLGDHLVRTRHDWEMHGEPVTEESIVDWRANRSRPGWISVRVGEWQSGFYYARLSDDTGRVGYAPIVVRPKRIGTRRVAVLLPTNTWGAYNFDDVDGNGWGDTWYAGWIVMHTRLGRHYQGWGMPPVFRRYDLPFLRWLLHTGRDVDYLTDTDLDGVASARRLRSAYDLIVFEGHTEYVSTHEHDLIRGYRNLGGNLAYLSADNFYWQVRVRGRTIERAQPWRRLGEPESELVGVQWREVFGRRAAPYVARHVEKARWLFEGTRIGNGTRFLRGGIEIDATTAQSPRGTVVLAEIPSLFGGGETAQMTYYRAGEAKVFAAGAFTLAGSAMTPLGGRLLANLWAFMARG